MMTGVDESSAKLSISAMTGPHANGQVVVGPLMTP